jgi:hypothetical protein
MVVPDGQSGSGGTATKIGEYPAFGPPTPTRLITMIGPDRELFLKGRRAENHGLGLGAFAYYRRVVEEQRLRLLGEVVRVAQKVGAKEEIIRTLEAAMKEQQFSKSLEMTKGAMPESLLIDGHNPMMLLHRALSMGLHDGTDEECLAGARAIRLVLADFAERVNQVLKDATELKDAVGYLLSTASRKGGATEPSTE